MEPSASALPDWPTHVSGLLSTSATQTLNCLKLMVCTSYLPLYSTMVLPMTSLGFQSNSSIEHQNSAEEVCQKRGVERGDICGVETLIRPGRSPASCQIQFAGVVGCQIRMQIETEAGDLVCYMYAVP